MGYCQDGLTDGFIAFEALEYLGVKVSTAKKLKVALVANGLWDEVPGGWMVHDYLKHNRSSSDIQTTKERRKAGGSLGGRPTIEPPSKTLEVIGVVNLPDNPPQIRSDQQQINSATASVPRPTPIIAKRRLDAAWEGPRVYVPQRVHTDFLALRGGAEKQLWDWYEVVSNEWTTGIRAGDEPGSDMIKFWKARYDEQWPAASPATTKKWAGWQQRAGVKS